MGGEKRRTNVLLSQETQRVLLEKDWSIRDAEDATGVSSGTVLNMKRGRNVKITNILQFARAIAPPGRELLVEHRWLDIATRQETDQPAINYSTGEIEGVEYIPPTPQSPVVREAREGEEIILRSGLRARISLTTEAGETVELTEDLLKVWQAVAALQRSSEK
jgi:hypothetical protein